MIFSSLGNTYYVKTPADDTFKTARIYSNYTYFVFGVRTCMDAHVGLLPPTGSTESYYEVVIGGYSNSRSDIRRWPDVGIPVHVQTPNILNCDQYRHFWVSWDNNEGIIRLGTGTIVGLLEFLSWTDPNFLIPESFAISTWHNDDGDWEMEQRFGMFHSKRKPRVDHYLFEGHGQLWRQKRFSLM